MIMFDETKNDTPVLPIGITDIMQRLPHAYPFLLLDRVIEMEIPNRLVGVKNVTFNEPHFQGHFPNDPIMPGVLIIEAMAQAGGILVVYSVNQRDSVAKDKKVYITGIDEAKFRRPVVPGDQLVLEVIKKRSRGMFTKMDCTASVDGKIVTQASITAMLKD